MPDRKGLRPADRKTSPATGSGERSNDALNTFIAARAEIDELLRRLQALSDDRFNTHPDDINWGEVGTLQNYAARLREITDNALREGECAK